jgi:adenine/guanine/hypoxanthine permease
MLGGLTTFVTMAYIIVVNPQILAQAGMPAEGVVFATCVSAAAATLVMGLYAKLSHRVGAGMSLNAHFTYSVCIAIWNRSAWNASRDHDAANNDLRDAASLFHSLAA